jgi:hypothetical protein
VFPSKKKTVGNSESAWRGVLGTIRVECGRLHDVARLYYGIKIRLQALVQTRPERTYREVRCPPTGISVGLYIHTHVLHHLI